MKTIDLRKTWISLLILPLVMMSCNKDYLPGITGYGDVVTQYLMLDDFTGFGNSIAADIFISQGEEQEVIIEAQQNIIDNIELDRVENGFWSMKYDRWVRKSEQVKIYITIPSLDKVSISGLGNIEGETSFIGLDDVELKVSGSGSISLDLECNDLEILVSGSGDFDLSGETQTVEASISGLGNVHAFDLETNRAEIKISGSGDTSLSVVDFLKVDISGSGNVIYRGTPQTDVSVSGSGRVTRDQ